MSYRFNSSNIIYIYSIKQIERIVFEKPNEKNYNKYKVASIFKEGKRVLNLRDYQYFVCLSKSIIS